MSDVFTPLPDGPYQILLADCPWLYRDGRNKASAGMARAAYPCLKPEELAALPVSTIADKQSALFMWATAPKMPEAIELVRAWGFTYCTFGFVWVKLRPGFGGDPMHSLVFPARDIYKGLGHYTRANAEMVILARKGKPLPRFNRTVSQIVLAPRGRHSAKPSIHGLIDRMLGGPYRRIELFCRGKAAPGWDSWGLEAQG